MRSKTILAAVIAGALGVPLTSIADDYSGSRTPSAGASASGNASVQGALGTNDPSSQAYGQNSQNRSGRYAQNEDKDKDNDRDHDRGRELGQRNPNTKNDQYGNSANSQYSQNGSGQSNSSQYPQSGSSQTPSQSQYGSSSGGSTQSQPPSQYSSNSGSSNQRYSSSGSY